MEGCFRISFGCLLFTFRVVLDELNEVELLTVMVAMVLPIVIMQVPLLVNVVGHCPCAPQLGEFTKRVLADGRARSAS